MEGFDEAWVASLLNVLWPNHTAGTAAGPIDFLALATDSVSVNGVQQCRLRGLLTHDHSLGDHPSKDLPLGDHPLGTFLQAGLAWEDWSSFWNIQGDGKYVRAIQDDLFASQKCRI